MSSPTPRGLVVWEQRRQGPALTLLSCLTHTARERAMRQPVETGKGESYRSRIAETGSLINQEEKQQQGMV